jgi:hypothetical protein
MVAKSFDLYGMCLGQVQRVRMAECTCARSARAWANVTCQCGGGRLHGGVTDIGEARWRGRSTGEYYFVYYGPGDFEEVETLYVLRMRQRYLELRAENNLHQCMDVIGERLVTFCNSFLFCPSRVKSKALTLVILVDLIQHVSCQ